MKTKLRTDISAEELFLLRIKYGTEKVEVSDIHESDYKYFEKLDYVIVLTQLSLITEKMKDLLDFDGFDGDLWDFVLRKVPAFGKYCDWDKLRGGDWSHLLREQPQFAEYCNWSKLTLDHWVGLLRVRPQFAENCEHWDSLNGSHWVQLLQAQPQLIKFFTGTNLDVLDWNILLRSQPHLEKYRK